MHLSTTSRSPRVRRLLAVSAAAVAVMIGPTACDYGGYGSASVGHDMGDMGDMDHGAQQPQQPVVVPVGNTVESTSEPAADAAAQTTGTASARSSDRRFRDRDRDRDRNRGRGRGQPRPTKVTIPAPVQGVPVGNETIAPVDNAAPVDTAAPVETAAPTETAAQTATAPATAPPVNNGLDVLGRDCAKSNLPEHDGFQKSPACVSTAMGEVAAEDKLPSLLITDAPKTVGVGEEFTLQISTRNLKRDRFLGAAAGGYYLESSFLDGNGIQRGHFHTACRILPSSTEAPDSSGTPAFFLATQDNGGGSTPDTVTIKVPGIQTAGELQCTSWAGDGSHRTPMMTRANQTPAIDSVRITVTGNAPAVANDAAATAEAQADEAEQARAEAAEAGAQRPDQDGAVQELPAGVGSAGDGAADPAATSAPVVEQSAPAVEQSAPPAEAGAGAGN